jgi:hypothetical protein
VSGSVLSPVILSFKNYIDLTSDLDHYKNSLIAKLAAKVSSLYNSSLLSIRQAAADTRDALPPVSRISWLPP